MTTPIKRQKLARIAHRLSAHINVIALNPTPLTPHRRPDRMGINDFMDELARHGANATFRETRGQEIDAACGQLRIRSATDKARGDQS